MAKRNKEYLTIAIAGKMNAGKSTLLNLLSGQKDYAIVDTTPGTTADTVITRMEIHGLGPVKILDTAGIDESGELGKKKRKKTFEAVEEADLTLLVFNSDQDQEDLSFERDIVDRARKYLGQVVVIYNTINPNSNNKISDQFGLPSIALNASETSEQERLIAFIDKNFVRETRDVDLIPLENKKGFVLLNIPMDEETPTLRLLRPQDMAMERILRKFLIPVLFRMNLGKARSGDESERERFNILVRDLRQSEEGLCLIITDSQAMDIMNDWSPKDISLTTFSVMMVNFMSCGNLKILVDGISAFSTMKDSDKVLVMEACNHNRKCDDIGTKQIPRLIKEKLGLDLQIDFSFGRVFPENISEYKAVLHCGGCMIDRQKFARRIKKCEEVGVSITNYGLFLSWIQDKDAVDRVTKIFTN